MREVYYWQAIQEALIEEMRRDDRVFLFGEDIAEYGGAFGVTRGMVKEFGQERVKNTPISEASIVGVATGASLLGLRPVVEIMFMDFITLCMDQILNHATKYRYMYAGQVKVPLVIRTPAGGKRAYGPTHSQSLEAWFMHIPGLIIAVPSTPYDAKGLLKTAIREDNPVLFVEHKLLYSTKGEVPKEEYQLPFGKAVTRCEGKDVTIVCYSEMVIHALAAARELKNENIYVEVIDLRTLAPLDIVTVISSVKKTGKIIIAEEGWKTAGVGAEIAAQIIEHIYDYLEAPIIRVAAKDVHIPSSELLERLILPGKEEIIDAVKKVMGRV
jgi:pyruvate/2-oxoglutarate/acetoin dehydrogenase E1 component